jgi:HK97 family phage major capsid protein
MTLKELYERKEALYKDIRRLREKFDTEAEPTAEDRQNWDGLNTDFDGVCETIAREERLLEIDKRMEQPRDTKKIARRDEPRTAVRPAGKDSELCLRALAVQNRRSLTQQEADACRRYGFNPSQSEIELNMTPDPEGFRRSWRDGNLQYRAAGVDQIDTKTDEGANIVPTEMMSTWEVALLETSPIRQVSRIIRTASGGDLIWPTINDTTVSAAVVAEAGALAAADLETANITFKAWKFYSLVKVSSELVQDAVFNLSRELGTVLGQRVGRGTNTQYTLGDGTTEPQGYLVGGTTVAAGSTSFAVGDLFNLYHALEPLYRPNAVWFAHDTLIKKVRLLATTNGQYLWQPGLQQGQPDMVFGRPIYINQDADGTDLTADITFAFGDFANRFIIRDCTGIRLRRLDELYMGNDSIGFVIFLRTDSRVLDAGTNPIRFLTNT